MRRRARRRGRVGRRTHSRKRSRGRRKKGYSKFRVARGGIRL